MEYRLCADRQHLLQGLNLIKKTVRRVHRRDPFAEGRSSEARIAERKLDALVRRVAKSLARWGHRRRRRGPRRAAA